MKIVRGYAGGWFISFKDGVAAGEWAWLFDGILRMRPSSCGQFDNAFLIWESGRIHWLHRLRWKLYWWILAWSPNPTGTRAAVLRFLAKFPL